MASLLLDTDNAEPHQSVPDCTSSGAPLTCCACILHVRCALPLLSPVPSGCPGQDNFVSHTMRAEDEANLERIREQKSKSDVTHPLEPLVMSLIKGYVDNQDLAEKIKALYQVIIQKNL